MTDTHALPRTLMHERTSAGPHHGLRHVLGPDAWSRLPEAVRERFADTTAAVDYAGAFEVVQASMLGRAIAWLGTLFGTPVAPRAEINVEAEVRVTPDRNGVAWQREYRWADGSLTLVTSTKVVTEEGQLIERLPARLCMPLRTYEAGGVLHFVSRGYYFDLGLGFKLWLPPLLSPGVTHVEHIDLGHGWFRFTMRVTHPVFGLLFFQTGRFCAAER
jgi:Domain of unknown function (DUF4166)